MFNKLKNKIKYKLMNWLEIEQLQKDYQIHIEQYNWDKENFDNYINYIRKMVNNNYNEQSGKLDALNRTLQSVISLGADVVPYDNNSSWAVVCMEGRHNIVKFIDMHGQDYRYILDFLKQFECSRRVIDAPKKYIFEDEFVWKKGD